MAAPELVQKESEFEKLRPPIQEIIAFTNTLDERYREKCFTYVVVSGSNFAPSTTTFHGMHRSKWVLMVLCKVSLAMFYFYSPLQPKVHLYNEFWAKLLYRDFVLVSLRGSGAVDEISSSLFRGRYCLFHAFCWRNNVPLVSLGFSA